MTVAVYKRKWFMARRAELHARGLKDVGIAEQMGLKRSRLSQVVNGANVGDEFIDRMCKAFAFTFPSSDDVSEKRNTSADPSTLAEVAQEMKLHRHLLTAILEEMKK